MTNSCLFHFAVKPGHDPVQLPNLSAHSTLPWVARGYEIYPVFWSPIIGAEWLIVDVERIYKQFDVDRAQVPFVVNNSVKMMRTKIGECVSKSVSKLKDTSFATSRL